MLFFPPAAGSVENCHPFDIHDLRLVMDEEKQFLLDLGYTVVAGEGWPTGELNAELSASLPRKALALFTDAFGGTVGKPRQPKSSRVLLSLSCDGLKRLLARPGPKPALLAGNDDVLVPITGEMHRWHWGSEALFFRSPSPFHQTPIALQI